MHSQGQLVLEGQLAQGMIFKGQQLGFPRVAVAAGLFDRSAVVGQLVGVDASQQFGTAPDKEEALAQEGAQGAFVGGIDVGWREEIAAQEVGEFLGINAVVLVLAAVNGLEVEGMGQNEVQASGLAGIGQPISAEHALGADGQVVLVRSDALEEAGEVVVLDVGVDQGFALAIHEADVHLPGVQINSAVEFCRGGIILHNVRRKVP